jgi:hypothetical protein
MKHGRNIKGAGSASGGVATRDYPVASLGPPIRRSGPTGVLFKFGRIALAGNRWTTTLQDFQVEIRSSDPDSLEVAWSALVRSPVRADLYNESVADVIWFLCLYRDGLPLPLAYFSDSFPRRCGTHVEGRRVGYSRDDGHNGRRWEWGADILRQLQECYSAAGKFVYALNATPCR